MFQLGSLFAVAGIAACKGGNDPKAVKDTVGTSEEKTGIATNQADPCDIQALTEKDRSNRKALGYVEQTPIPEKKCETCKLYVPANESKNCGTCALFKGPVTPEGYCTYWADPAS